MKKFEFHPIAKDLPLMEGEAFDKFVEDVKANGVFEQIVMLDGKILDGRNRYRAACKAGVDAPTRKFDASIDGDSPAKFVERVNGLRLHMNTSQLAMFAATLANLGDGQTKAGAPIGAPEKGCTPVSQSDAAEIAGVSRRAVQRAQKVIESAAAPVANAVRAGEVSVSDAAAVAELSKAEQKAALAKVESGKAKTLREAAKKPEVDAPRPSGKQKSDPRAWQRVEDLYGKLKREVDALNKSSPAERFCRQAQAKLNEFHGVVFQEWRRAVR